MNDYPYLCECACHHRRPGSRLIHFTACCHPCPDCGAAIVVGRMESHAAIAHGRVLVLTVSERGVLRR